MADDFDLDGLANFLHLEPERVVRLVTRGQIPGRKVGGQWKFSPAEIHHWLEVRIGASDEIELARLESALERAHRAEGPPDLEDYSLAMLLPSEAVAVPLLARTRNSVITTLVEVAAGTGWLWDVDRMVQAVRQREELHPTVIAGGVALLHPRRPLAEILAQPFLAFGRTPQTLPFGGPGSDMTDLFFLVCSTDDRGHLRTLARLTRLLAQPGFLADLRAQPDPASAHTLLLDRERTLTQGPS